MKGDQMGTCIAYPTQRELPLSNWTWFRKKLDRQSWLASCVEGVVL
jgi:hypothetical protein